VPDDHRRLLHARRYALSESFEAGRLLRVHPGPLAVECGPSLVVVRAVEIYPNGTVVTWTCSPAGSEVARLAQGTPRATVRIGDEAGTAYAPLGESVQGGGRTLFGASFFGAAPPPGATSLQIECEVTGALGGGLSLPGRATFSLR
jgi:hypothetical protein